MGNVYFYSERGLINCLVLDLNNNLDKTKEFLRLIKFGMDEKTADWVDKVLSVDWYIEFSASEFGNPDLIADVNCTDGHRVIVFEAKLKSYEKSAAFIDMTAPFEANPNGDYPDGIYKSKSSSINAQLALRYRLARTLNNLQWLELLSSDEPRIEESYEDAVSYHDMFKAIREVKTGRRIHNRRMIDVLYTITQSRHDFYFVAMTFESQNHIFKTIQDSAPNLLPPLGIAKWKTVNGQFGILNFNVLIRSLPLDDNSYLNLSRNYINFYPQDNTKINEIEYDSDEAEQEEAEREELSSKDRFLQNNLPNSDVYAIWFEKLKAIIGFVDYKTSCSISKVGKTIVKLMYKNRKVYLGFRDCLPDGLPNRETITISIQRVRFFCIPLIGMNEETNLRIENAIRQLLSA